MAKDTLNPRQARFVAEYLVDLNATQAALRAGYAKKSAAVQGCELLKVPKVARAVEEGRKKQLDAACMSAQQVLEELTNIGKSNIRDLLDETGAMKPLKDIPDAALKTVAGVEFVVNQDGETIRKVKRWDKLRALERMGTYHRLWSDGAQVAGDLVINFTNVRSPGDKKG